MDPKIIEKLKQLRDYYYDDAFSLKWIEETEKKIRKLIAQDNLTKNKSVVAIIEDAKNRINTINQFLTMDENLTQEDRNRLYRERTVHQFYLDRFEGRDIEKRFESINSVLNEEVNRIGGSDK